MPRDFSDECFCLFLINQIVVRFRCETPDCFTHEMVFRRHWEISAQRGSRSVAGATYQCAIRGRGGKARDLRRRRGDFVGASLLANRTSRLTAWPFVLPKGPLSLKGGGRPCMGEESSTPASPAGVWPGLGLQMRLGALHQHRARPPLQGHMHAVGEVLEALAQVGQAGAGGRQVEPPASTPPRPNPGRYPAQSTPDFSRTNTGSSRLHLPYSNCCHAGLSRLGGSYRSAS
ncbi:hypothetical protein PcP3B5_08100 [Pseudomonas citronellolis]|nr:hypothetical protein PcP3B5_08100 [Pseudomonas citronellolis]